VGFKTEKKTGDSVHQKGVRGKTKKNHVGCAPTVFPKPDMPDRQKRAQKKTGKLEQKVMPSKEKGRLETEGQRKKGCQGWEPWVRKEGELVPGPPDWDEFSGLKTRGEPWSQKGRSNTSRSEGKASSFLYQGGKKSIEWQQGRGKKRPTKTKNREWDSGTRVAVVPVIGLIHVKKKGIQSIPENKVK